MCNLVGDPARLLGVVGLRLELDLQLGRDNEPRGGIWIGSLTLLDVPRHLKTRRELICLKNWAELIWKISNLKTPTVAPLQRWKSFNVGESRDRIKGLILRRLNAYFGTAATHKPQYTRWTTFHLVHCGNAAFKFCCRNARAAIPRALRLVHCSSYKFEGSCRNAWATMHAMNYIPSRALQFVHCGGAAVGVEVPQSKPFYTVPVNFSLLSFCWKVHLNGLRLIYRFGKNNNFSASI